VKVKIQVEFVVEPVDDEELTENQALSAASLAAWDNLCLTHNGRDIVEIATVYVDGLGECEVSVGEDHD